MGNCNNYTKLFSDYMDKNLNKGDKKTLQTHLDTCDSCRIKMNNLQHVKRSLGSLPRVKTSDSFDIVLHARLRQEIRAEQSRQSRRWTFPFFELNWKVPAYAVAALVLLFFGAQIQRINSPQLVRYQNSNMLTVKNALNGEFNHVDPGYMVIVGIDTVNNKYMVTNYTDINNVDTLKSFTYRTDNEEFIVQNQLPSLKNAPHNKTVLTQKRKQFTQAKVKQAEFVF